MNISSKGVTSIGDDDEEYLRTDEIEGGILSLQIDSSYFHELLIEALKKSPDFYETQLFKLLEEIHIGKENQGECCDLIFRSNIKKLICPRCGKKVPLT